MTEQTLEQFSKDKQKLKEDIEQLLLDFIEKYEPRQLRLTTEQVRNPGQTIFVFVEVEVNV